MTTAGLLEIKWDQALSLHDMPGGIGSAWLRRKSPRILHVAVVG
jgi:hypothetical protein